ncbi:probable inactive histone-lysine N-methyltransferase SUVR1 [Salvia miltiorrhiza]|uniref:probable inactive histone-lysine N-methyltransferase SUVR1 n=1 Tax=Salvia miltiorrhiza TaxID=226208 RepID=UPI0025ABC555|nr:probable inactive histone-lysine N-methyltransferase SUVR1 [Salvia miltiorrhiza]
MGRPRGRPRILRPRLSRMDAAVDAMLPLGFPEAKVKKRVNQLLKVYGGDEGWPFIEECSYKVLLDSLLEEKDDEEQVTSQNGLLLEPVENRELLDKPQGDEDLSCSRASDALIEHPSEAVAEDTPLPASSPPRDSTHLLLLPANTRTRFPCYGWIESDEDDADEFINLAPAPAAIATLNVPPWRKKRRSRWDVKPGDP